MPRLHPIAALRFASESGQISSKIAPPYDVLDEGPKRQLLARDDHNIVAVDLPVTPPKTVGPPEAYTHAADTFRQWIDAGVLHRDPTPALYAYEQVYTVAGREFRRRGLFVGVETEPFNRPNGIWRHEHTIKAGTDDRMLLMQATEAQLSPIFGVFHDEAGDVAGLLADDFAREPDFQGRTENDGVDHRCWVVTDAAKIEQLQSRFALTDVFIADGHHRYTTALNYSQQHADNPAAGVCLFVLVAIEDPGMIVLPTHRVVTGLQDLSIESLRHAVASCDALELKETEFAPADAPTLAEKLSTLGPHAMGVHLPGESKLWLLTSKGDDPLGAVLPHKPEVWRKLDVAVLHELVMDSVLRPAFGGDQVGFKYTADVSEMRTMTEAAKDRLGIIMQATRLGDVCEVSLANEVMPPKSTYFYPKLATGLVINPLW